ncbi:MAG: tripartite tricarboxylate transporter substrate binding protein [Candidatus Rokubacteria bacterium]|nr:tripartite tricarboxylate transporter substrate binding protein [Candidatus Rokubacteria bacterium]
MRSAGIRALIGVLAVGVLATLVGPAAAWEPTKPVEFVIMAGQGGGADQYARLISGLIDKHKLAPVSFVPLNKDGGAGAVAMQYVKGKEGDPHTIMITLSSFLMTPINQKLPFNYRDYTPIALVALDNFFLWVHKENPIQTVKDFVTEAQKRPMTVGGTGSKQEDELIFTFFEQQAGLKPFKYVPFKGGGSVAAALVGKQVEATVNNPSEALAHHPDRVRILATFAEKRHARLPDLPTMKELGYDVTYQMLRGIFGPPKMPAEAREYYVTLLKKVFDLKDFQEFLERNVLDPRFMTTDDFGRWVAGQHELHEQIMRKAGWAK